ncbi:alpha/beta fold hydrolase [Legionella pneumophila]|uniref:Hydrolases or acyltransferases (Alpha/beta hydrolase superfamily) n=1 Tax=Legionella pneumophila subsp. pascullei TaxID=91890 RepID=A0AAX2IWP9_LEGPN|nr:alpha/beta hydrolase [Legionella pneumophila]AMP89627.1 alpha/beta hydrolase [Legionella pneumophila subsp. pascullei]AMP92707.1 hydrolase [Legionella pneumophila subsp. pascullei]AMP95673.1 hydrolase [Legionella pneumophila subsp. pascullei]SQG90584.1 hydrolases or acyltransferases (alpha/beta hydrolase superfamily) [Legionella pneumophila subsp. pascullei]VEH07129.1 hydrolases or acyltransferases (alpha/beta hydrolase superfamily) [Legionella pneumophila subsp. pascullei]
MRELIHFAHGNGFPSLCYKQLLEQLETRFDCCFIDKIGHDPDYPVGENWYNLVTEIIASIKRQAGQPVIAVGHSLGGVLSLLAAIEEPQLFKAVIMLDSPLIGAFKSSMVRLAKALGIIDRVTPAFKTKKRREHWQNYEQLISYLKTRDLFKTFTEECLNDYIKYGLEYKEDGYYLRFDRHIEYQIYRTIPHVIPRYKGKLIVPAALIYGDKSTVVDRMDIRYMKNHFNVKCFKTMGTHLFPMEHPEAVGKQIIEVVDAII